MSTRCRIAYADENGFYHSAFCRWDGYESHTGKLLMECYNTLDKVKALVDGGDFSCLNASLDAVKRYNEGSEAPLLKGIEELTDYHFKAYDDFLYVFEDGDWYYWNYDEYKGELADYFRRECDNV